MVSMALVVAIGVRSDGEREVLGLDLGPSEEAAFWQAFLRTLARVNGPVAKLVQELGNLARIPSWRGEGS